MERQKMSENDPSNKIFVEANTRKSKCKMSMNIW